MESFMNFVSDEKYKVPTKTVTELFDRKGELTEKEDEALVKVIRHESGQSVNYVRENAFGTQSGLLVDPFSTTVKNFGQKTVDVPEFPFRKVSPTSVAYYLEFLKKKQPSFLRLANRDNS